MKMDVMAKLATSVGMARASPTTAPTALAVAHESMERTFTAVAQAASHEGSEDSRSMFTPNVSSVTVAANSALRGLATGAMAGAKAAEYRSCLMLTREIDAPMDQGPWPASHRLGSMNWPAPE